MRKHLLPFGLAAALLSPAPTWSQTPLTLAQALEQATLRNPTLAAAAREVEAAGGAVQQAHSRRNPELSTMLEDVRRQTRTTTATLAIPLELGGKRAARVSVAERAQGLATAEWVQAGAELRAHVVEAFFDVLAAQERARLAASSADMASRAAQAVGRRVAAGKLSPVEETRARVDEANAQLEASEATTGLQIARQSLAVQLGDAMPAFGEVGGDAGEVPTRPPLADLLAQLDDMPSVRVARIELERRRALVEMERSKAVPDVTLSVGARREHELGRTQAVVGVAVPLPLFDRNQGAVLEASRRAEKASDELRAARLRAVAQLQEASGRLSLAGSSLQLLQSTVLPAAQGAYEAARKGFDAGKFGFLDVIDAQRALLQARARYLNTLSAAYQAAAAVDRIAGR